ncbi:MAG: RNA polymerase sigma factor [Thermoanaerobaculia bacterium]|nr:RNA polymerase sigma factor [Thermoanaerobaculia bacterium]
MGSNADNPDVVARAVRRFQDGEEREASFRTLFDLHHSAVEGFFVRRTASTEESLDLMQETFLRAYKGLDGYQWQAPFGAWLFRIAWNVLKTSATRAQSSWPWGHQTELEESVTQSADPARHRTAENAAPSALLQEERRQLLRLAIERLPAQRRRCVVLWAYHELTYQQIAVVLRISIGTVKAHMSQAKEQLGGILAEIEETATHG